MEKAYRFRAYPTKEQEILLAKTFGCVRYVYNYFLDLKKTMWESERKNISFTETSRLLTQLKQEKEWLKEPDKCALQNALKDLDSAYQGFFKMGRGYPKFKSKHNHRRSYRSNRSNNNIDFCGNYIKLPKLGKVKIRDHQVPCGRILNATITQEPSGRYYISLCCTNVPEQDFIPTENQIGIDLGVKTFATLSDGTEIPNPKHLNRSLERLVFLQRSVSRKTRDSGKWKKARVKVARQYEKIRNQRKDFLQKVTTSIVRNNQVICIEDLNVTEMLQTADSNLARQISDVSWAEFARILDYKTQWNHRDLVKVDTYFPSSQLCSHCGYQNREVKDLSIREWTCPMCNTYHNRDLNAAINILNEGLSLLH